MKNRRDSIEELDIKIEYILANLLRIGVIVAASVVMIGAVLFIIRHGKEVPDYSNFIFHPFSVDDPLTLLKEVAAFKSIAIMKLGILFLIGTPILRVIISIAAFIYEKDLMYVLFTLVVLVFLIFSFFY